jgi:hypothetical protein
MRGKNNKTISQELHLQEETVGKWRKRWLSAATKLSGVFNLLFSFCNGFIFLTYKISTNKSQTLPIRLINAN